MKKSENIVKKLIGEAKPIRQSNQGKTAEDVARLVDEYAGNEDVAGALYEDADLVCQVEDGLENVELLVDMVNANPGKVFTHVPVEGGCLVFIGSPDEVYTRIKEIVDALG